MGRPLSHGNEGIVVRARGVDLYGLPPCLYGRGQEEEEKEEE